MPVNPVRPMLAITGEPFSSPEWIFEPKFDGTRAIAHISAGSVTLQNRRLRVITARYPELEGGILQAAGRDCTLDGEIVVFDGEEIDFSALQRREQQRDATKIAYLAATIPATYVVFDILSLEGADLTREPLMERKERLRDAVAPNERVVVIDYVKEIGEEYFTAAMQLGMEGIMAKRLGSTYQPGERSRDWVKIKRRIDLDLVVGGYTAGSGSREETFGALVLGAYDEEGNLVPVGRAGTGFSREEAARILSILQEASRSPFSPPPDIPDVTWVIPEMVVEIGAQEVTAGGSLRAPVFLRIRDDKPPEECTLKEIEQAGGAD